MDASKSFCNTSSIFSTLPTSPTRISRRYSLGAGPRLVAPIAWVRIPVAAFFFFFFFLFSYLFCFDLARPSSNGHTRLKAPHPIRTAKLSSLGPDQYYSWGQCGNLGCCWAAFVIFATSCLGRSVLCRQGSRHTVIPR